MEVVDLEGLGWLVGCSALGHVDSLIDPVKVRDTGEAIGGKYQQ